MPELKIASIAFQLFYYCDEDDCDGKVEFAHKRIGSDPVMYRHICVKCGKIYAFPKIYPDTVKNEKRPWE